MRRVKKSLLALVVVVLGLTGALGAFAAGSGEGQAAKSTEPIPLMHDKGGSVGWSSRLEELSKAYTDKTGNAGVKPVEFPSTDVFMTSLRASLSSPDPTTMFTWWAGRRMDEFVKEGLVADVSKLWDKYGDQYAPGLRRAYMVGDKTYALPATIAYWVMFYNPKVFAKCGVKPPQTWDQLLQVCETLKANGVIPMALSTQGGWPPMVQFMEFLVRIDPDFYEKLMDGKAKYTDEPVRETFAVWRQLIEKGYFSDHATDLFSEFPRLMADGKAAMIDMGTWYASVLDAAGMKVGVDYDFFLIPPIKPKAGKLVIYEATPILLAEKAKNKAAAVKFADWFMSADAQEKWAALIGQFPSNKNSKVTFLQEPFQRLLTTVNKEKYRQVNRFWEATLPDIASEALVQFAEFVLHPGNAETVMKNLQNNADTFWAKAGK